MTFKQVLSYFLTGAAVLSVTTTALAADVPTDVRASVWYHPAVEYVLENGLMDTASQGAFAPDDPVTRRQAADAICRGAKRRGQGQALPVTDAAQAVRLLPGAADGAVTREELAVLLAWYDRLLRSGETAPIGRWDDADKELRSFTDYDTVSAWARDSITLCLADDLLHGNVDGSFGPQEAVTRAELAQVLYNVAHR